MKRYGNRGGNAGIVAYDYGRDWIRLRFVDGQVYHYTADGVGADNLDAMKRLADAGRGLTTFVNTHPGVREGYAK